MQYLYFIYIQGIYDNLGRIDAPNPIYPCAYREHHGSMPPDLIDYGLSLCIQGTFSYSLFLVTRSRFIPVHTGNINLNPPAVWSHSVYPCAYREHYQKGFNEMTNSGLSLCIQGTFFQCINNQLIVRFIPVHTGNITNTECTSNIWSVYPCAYREHLLIYSDCH